MSRVTILDTHHAIVGSSGGGKTVTAKAEVEQLLGERRHLAVIDPTGVWWGLRSNAAGDGAGYDVPIFGGEHGDVAIAAGDGDAIARIIIEQGVSAIVDLSALHDAADQRRFNAAFVKRLRHKPKGNFHLVVDEADELCPQTARDDVGFSLTEDMIWVAKRGRSAGFVLTVITQRPADIAKAVLSQMQTLITHQLVDPRDQKAIDDYLRATGDKASRDQVMGSLATLAVGERWIYSPRLHVLERGVTAPIATFDSSRTPAPGETPRTPKMLAQLDVTAIRAALSAPGAATIEDAIPAEPLEALAKGAVVGEAIAGRDRRIAELEARVAELEAANAELDAECDGYQDGLNELEELLRKVRSGQAKRSKSIAVAAASAAEPLAPAPAKRMSGGADVDAIKAGLGAERRTLAVLVSLAPASASEATWALLAGMKRTGGAWNSYKSKLRAAGLIETGATTSHWRATDLGAAVLDGEVPQLPAAGPALVSFWADRLPGAGRMLRKLEQLYPHLMTRDALAAELHMSAAGGAFGAALSRLRTAGLLEEQNKRLRLMPALMGDR